MLRGSTTTALALLLALLLTGAARAGVNAGFTAQLGVPERIENPAVGQVISIPVRVQGTTQIKGVTVRMGYDPALVEFRGFTQGPLLAEAVGLPGQPVVRDDGLAVIEAGTVLLGKGVTRATTGGLFGTFDFELVSDLPDEGTPIVLLVAVVRTSPDEADTDVFRPEPGGVGVRLVPVFNNPIFNVVVERRHNGALITWNTRFPGLQDAARVRPAGSTQDFRVVTSPLAKRFTDRDLLAVKVLVRNDVPIETLSDADLAARIRDLIELPGDFSDRQLGELVRRLRELPRILESRSHVVPVGGLEPMTEYEFELVSRDLQGRRSPVHRDRFRTRSAPDLRPLFISAFEVQTTRSGAAVSFGANRPATTNYALTRVSDDTVVDADTLNEDGETRTRFTLEDLEASTEYDLELVARLVNADELIAAGLPEEGASKRFGRRFRTRAATRPLRLEGPPVKIVGADRANIVFEVNQPVGAIVDYGIVTDDGTSGSLPAAPYSWSQESVGTLTRHNLTLSNLDPGTLFRYKITLVSPEGDTFSTDPRGNFQWSRDLKFRTAAAADTLPAEVIQGPVVDIRDVLAVVRFATDVPTAATIFIGTEGGTYKTEDEFEFPDVTPDGERRFANHHSIILSGLKAGQSYRYRLEVETSAGKITVVEPGAAAAGKRLGVLQPPGGAGSFTTSNDPDTQFPVILSGPTVSSKTHETAVIEWTTDEPADSEVRFGLAAVAENTESSAQVETAHKLVLSNLDPGTSYAYLIGSTDASGNGASLSSQAVFTTDPEVDLTAPQIVDAPEVVYKNDESATIQWTTDEDATGEVTFGTSADDLGFVRTLPTTDQDHEVTLTNLEPSTTYFFQAASEDLSNNGPTTSAVASFTTDDAADLSPPVVGAVTVAAGDSTAILTWTTDELADSFVDFGTVSGLLDVTTGDAQDVLDHELTLTNLAPGTTYFYTVGSIDRAGNGPTKSAESSFTTLVSADVTPPATPADLAGTAGNEQVVLSWTANTELDLAGYNIYRRAAGADTFAAVITRVQGTTYTDLGLTNDVEVEYRITAIDRETAPNESIPSTTLSFTPNLSAAPTAPTDLAVGGESLMPTFTFTNATSFKIGAVLSYTIQVSTEPDFSNVTASESGLAEGTGTTSWTIDRELVDGQTYYWRVRAVEGSLPGPFTEAQQFTAEGPALTGDFDKSGAVDLIDFFLFADAFGKPVTDFGAFDLDGSGVGTVDLVDFFVFADVYGTSSGKLAGAAVIARRLERTGRIRLQAAGGPMGAADLPRDVVRLRVAGRDLEPLRAYGLVLTWDPAALTFTGATEGPGPLLENRGGRATLFHVLDQRPGRVVVVNAAPAEASGSGLLAELAFRLRDRRLASGTRFTMPEAYVAASAGDVRRVVDVEPVPLRPVDFALGLAYPNPFNPATQIDFSLAAESPVRLVVYDVLGRSVRTLVRADQGLSAGFYSVTWDGRDEAGRAVGNGLYLYRLETPAFRRTGKMMLLK